MTIWTTRIEEGRDSIMSLYTELLDSIKKNINTKCDLYFKESKNKIEAAVKHEEVQKNQMINKTLNVIKNEIHTLFAQAFIMLL